MPATDSGIPFKANDRFDFGVRGVQASIMRATIDVVNSQGVTDQFVIDVTSPTDRSVTSTSFFANFDGYVRAAAVTDLTSGVATPLVPGLIYAELHIWRGSGRFVNLLRGYYYDGHVPSFPGPLEGPLEGEGRYRLISLGDPALAAQIPVQTVPTGARQRVIGINAPETAAGAATRAWQILFTDGTSTFGAVEEVTGTATGITDNLMAMIAGISADLASLTENYIALPSVLKMPAGFTWQPFLNNIAAADNIGASFALVEEWLT